MEHDIQSLIKRIAEGDMTALGKLYDILAVQVFNYARTITNNREAAEDTTHVVFLQVSQKAARIAKTPNPTGYIMVMTRHHAYNLLKRGARETVLAEEPCGASCPSHSFDRLLLEEAFAALPVERRDTVYLHLVCGHSHKETARLQGVPTATVKWRYRKALSQIQAYFQEEEGVTCNE